ncbi:hypothetical protein EYF80_032636 [Liparis tanakae]|uniref:Uncharacterized protein n=1 Tax=Liparis tanakae TaxID=230148 RepID=A0A4Z2GWI6_9TELE|nr:hypothetical protein EYF80_032636 [Liparis tanakae]
MKTVRPVDESERRGLLLRVINVGEHNELLVSAVTRKPKRLSLSGIKQSDVSVVLDRCDAALIIQFHTDTSDLRDPVETNVTIYREEALYNWDPTFLT